MSRNTTAIIINIISESGNYSLQNLTQHKKDWAFNWPASHP